jgi:uncharacterized glyoxalase superfamily protein PhnB
MSGVIPAVRVGDMAEALDFYTDKLGFKLLRGGPAEEHCSIGRGDARLMLEKPASFYNPAYNEAIRQRLKTPSAMALYIEAPDVEVLYASVTATGMTIVDPLSDRPWGQREFTVADPGGNWLTFWQRLS